MKATKRLTYVTVVDYATNYIGIPYKDFDESAGWVSVELYTIIGDNGEILKDRLSAVQAVEEFNKLMEKAA